MNFYRSLTASTHETKVSKYIFGNQPQSRRVCAKKSHCISQKSFVRLLLQSAVNALSSLSQR